ncbi:arginyl-tRNA synthetase [Microbotryomycetes sp. JL201]|nr:arginyl-tRNA synthetase [Microbotryomycetes sp. JL201]
MSPSFLPPVPQLPGVADPALAVLDGFKLAAADYVSQQLGVTLEKAYEGVESGKVGKGAIGDFTVAVPRFRLGGKPQDHAKKLVDNFTPNEYLDSISANGAFVAINCNTANLTRAVMEQVNDLTYLAPAVAEIESSLSKVNLAQVPGYDKPPPGLSLFKKGGYGSNQSGAGKSVIVEFSSPNIAKPFHAGHLRSTIIGAFLANLYEANGYDVLRMNYLGDWGKQFGLLAVGYERYGSEEKLKEDPISHLYEVYVKINADGSVTGKRTNDKGEEESDGVPTPEATAVHDKAREFFVGMEKGEENALALWRKFRDLSIAKYKETYARLNIYFDIYSGESQVGQESQTSALEKLQESGIVKDSDGTLIVDLEQYKLGKTVVRKKDGTSVYITRDIGGAAERAAKYNFDKMIYVVASQQDLHLAQFFKVLDLMGYPWAKNLQHINFGMVLGMSTRKGTAVFLEQILNESRDVMHEQMRKNEAKYLAIDDPEVTSDKLGVTAVKVQDLAGKRINNYKFEWSRMTSFEGDTGPYLQYAHVRLSSVERKNAGEVVLPPPAERASKINTALLTDPKSREIILLLANYPDYVRQAFKGSEPSTVVTWCFRLCHAISSAWETLLVRGQPNDVALARLWLYVTAKDVLATAMRLLTLEPLEKM